MSASASEGGSANSAISSGNSRPCTVRSKCPSASRAAFASWNCATSSRASRFFSSIGFTELPPSACRISSISSSAMSVRYSLYGTIWSSGSDIALP